MLVARSDPTRRAVVGTLDRGRPAVADDWTAVRRAVWEGRTARLGRSVTLMSQDGTTSGPHVDGRLPVVEPGEHRVFASGLHSRWRPVGPAPVAMAAQITLAGHPDASDHRVLVRRADRAARDRHRTWASPADGAP